MDDLNQAVLAAIIGGVSGSIFAGLFTLLGVRNAHKLQVKNEEQKEIRRTQDVLNGVQTELEIVWDLYSLSTGAYVDCLPQDKPIDAIWYVSEDYFTFYHSHISTISSINDTELRDQILKSYTYLKALLDAFKLNNELVKSYKESSKLAELMGESGAIYNAQAQRDLSLLSRYGKSIRKAHDSTKSAVEPLIKTLRIKNKG